MTKMNDHDHVGELLDRYRTGELHEPDRHRVQSHLEMCAACRGELEALTAFARDVERGYAAEQAAQAADREPDWARLRASIVERTSARRAGAGRLRFGRYVPQAALAVLALIAVGVLWEQGVRGPGEAEEALRSERRTASRADKASEDSGGAVATAGAERAEMPTDEDQFAAAQRVEDAARANAVPPTVSQAGADARRHEVGLDEGQLRDRAAAVERNADRDAADAAAAGRVAEAPIEPAEGVEEAVAPLEPAEDPAERKAPPDAGRQEAEAPAGLGKAAAPPPELERFQTTARNALAEADTLLAARALSQWRDSLAPRQALPPELERAARALADSLAAFLATRP
ncbi:MAG: zf-HC2 domain-containing protein [Gemmatimonadota bacterium]